MKLGLAAGGLTVGAGDAEVLDAEALPAGLDCVLAGELQPAAIRQARPLTAVAKLFRIVSLSRFATRQCRVTGRVPWRRKHQEYRIAGCR